MTYAELKRLLTNHFPFSSYVFTSARYLRDISRTTDLLAGIANAGESHLSGRSAGTIVINSVRAYMPPQLAMETVLALKLRRRGYHVVMLYDDGVLRHHDTLCRADFSPWQAYYPLRQRLALRLLRRVQSISDMLVPYSDLLPDIDLEAAATRLEEDDGRWCGLDVRPFIQDSLVRFYASVPDDGLLSEEPDYARARAMFTENCILSLAVAQEAVRRLNPDALLTTHGIYSTWGPFMSYARKEGVKTVTFGCNGFRNNALDLSAGGIAASKDDNGYFAHFVNTVIGRDIPRDEVMGSVDKYMQARFGGDAPDVARVLDKSESEAHEVLERLKAWRHEGRRVFAMFPNVMWDNATTFHDNNRVFDSPVDWIVQTVRRFKEDPRDVLLIRIHPAENAFMRVRKSVRDILERYFGPEIFACANIICLPPDMRLPSYCLFDLIDAGIVYNGTIGLELIYKHKPVLIASKAAYSDKGFTWDIIGREAYFDAFEHTDDILRVQNEGKDLARYFIYEYFFLHGVPVELMSTERFLFPNVDGEPAKIWRDRNLDHIVSVMVGEEKYFQDYWRREGNQK